MAKEYNIDAVKPGMEGSINYWARILGMGGANIRTAIRSKALKAELKPVGDGALNAYVITAEQILDWRNSIRTAGTGERASATHFVFKTMSKITQEECDAANEVLKKAGIEWVLGRTIRPKKDSSKAGDTNEVPMPVVDKAEAQARLDALSQPEEKSGLFGRGKK